MSTNISGPVASSSSSTLSSTLSSTSSNSTAFALHLTERTVLTGANVSGQVQLDINAARRDSIRSVVVRLRGTVQTIIALSPPSQQRVDFLEIDIPLWLSDSAMTAPRIVTLPFSLAVPLDIPPSFSGGTQGRGGTINYNIEVIGKRKGFLKSKRRISRPLTIVVSAPVSTSTQDVKNRLRDGWNGPWKTHVMHSKVRGGPLSQIKAELSIPDLESYTSSTPIPYTLKLISLSKKLRPQVADTSQPPVADTSQPPMGLLPKHDTSDITLRFERTLSIKAAGVCENIVDEAKPVGGLGLDSVTRSRYNTNTRWMQIEAQEGIWEQTEIFEGQLILQGLPTFKAEYLSVTYSLHLHVSVPGLGNDLKADFPVAIDSGVGNFVDAPPAWSPTSTSTSFDPL